MLRKEFGMWGAFWRTLIQAFSVEKSKGDEVYIGAIAVSDSFRSRGVGTLLISAVEEYAKEKGFKSILLDVVNTNHRAHDLYRRLGFEDIKERKFGILTKRAGFTSAIKMKKKF